MVSPVTLQSAVAYDAADLNGETLDTQHFNAVQVWFTPAGSYDGTATFQVSPDAEATWFTIDGRLASTIETPLNAVASPAATGLYIVPVPSRCRFRVVMSGGTQGALTVEALPCFYNGL